VIPGRAEFDLEIRHLEAAVVDRVLDAFESRLREICAAEGCRASTAVRSSVPPARMDPKLMEALERACRASGRPFTRIPSGAGHDAQVMARHVPSAMPFVPSKRGISHAPEEDTSDDNLVLGGETPLHAVREL